MNEIYFLIYAVLHKLSYLNLQFNYIPAFHRANLLNLSVKREMQTIFCKTAKVSSIYKASVILFKGMITILTAIMVI